MRYLATTAVDRPNWVFFAGNVHESNGANDVAVRAQLVLYHGHRAGWKIHNTMAEQQTEQTRLARAGSPAPPAPNRTEQHRTAPGRDEQRHAAAPRCPAVQIIGAAPAGGLLRTRRGRLCASCRAWGTLHPFPFAINSLAAHQHG